MFPLVKDGFEYAFEEAALHFRSPDSKEMRFAFDRKLKLRHSPFTGALSIIGPEGKARLAPLSSAEQLSLLQEFFRRWQARNPEAAKKAAFDYTEGQKGFVAIAFGVSLLFCLPLAAGLYADSVDQFRCTKVLEESSTVGSMDVTKFKRKRKGHYILDLAFTAPDGTQILGRDQLIVEDEAQIPKSVPVIYSPSHPTCWSLTTDLKGTQVNWAQRRYFGYFTGMFGSFFLLTGLLGLAWSISRWMRPRPYREQIAKIFSL